MASWNFGHVLAVDDKKITASGMWVEPNFPSMFTVRMLKGNINGLSDPSTILINASLAKTLLGDVDPINKFIMLDNKDSYKVSGVFEDFPRNASLHDAQMFLPWKKYVTTEDWLKRAATQWNNHSWQAFVQVADNINMDKETQKIKDVVMVHKNEKTDGKEQAVLFPMNKWRLYSDFKDGKAAGGRIQFIWLFSIIGVFVLMLACINFMNLSTARSEKRAKEVGIRKTVGSVHSQLIKQFLSESVLVALISFVFSIIFVVLLMPMFNRLADKNIEFPWSSAYFWSIALA